MKRGIRPLLACAGILMVSAFALVVPPSRQEVRAQAFLTEQLIDRFTTASRGLVAAAKNNYQARVKFAAIGDSQKNAVDQEEAAVQQLTNVLESFPEGVAALKQAGLSSPEFARIFLRVVAAQAVAELQLKGVPESAIDPVLRQEVALVSKKRAEVAVALQDLKLWLSAPVTPMVVSVGDLWPSELLRLGLPLSFNHAGTVLRLIDAEYCGPGKDRRVGEFVGLAASGVPSDIGDVLRQEHCKATLAATAQALGGAKLMASGIVVRLSLQWEPWRATLRATEMVEWASTNGSITTKPRTIPGDSVEIDSLSTENIAVPIDNSRQVRVDVALEFAPQRIGLAALPVERRAEWNLDTQQGASILPAGVPDQSQWVATVPDTLVNYMLREQYADQNLPVGRGAGGGPPFSVRDIRVSSAADVYRITGAVANTPSNSVVKVALEWSGADLALRQALTQELTCGSATPAQCAILTAQIKAAVQFVNGKSGSLLRPPKAQPVGNFQLRPGGNRMSLAVVVQRTSVVSDRLVAYGLAGFQVLQ